MPYAEFPDILSPNAIKQLIGWVREAGQIALRYFNNVDFQYKADNTLLTQADLEIEQFLAERLRSTFPSCALIGEEGTRSKNDQVRSCLWAIDPIDGTTSFVQGLPGWGISLGLLQQGQPCFGLFYMPLLNDITYTATPDTVYNNDHPLNQSVRSKWGVEDFLAVSTGSHRDFQIKVERIRAMGSVSANLVYTARGSAAAALLPKARLWDLVAGAAILTKIGGEVRYLSGQSIDYLQLLDGQLAPGPIIAGHPGLLDLLQRAIRPRSAESLEKTH